MKIETFAIVNGARWFRVTFRGTRLLSPSVPRGIEECYLLATNA